MSKTLENHKRYLEFLKKQSKEDALKGLETSLKMKIIGKIAYKALLKELGYDNTIKPNSTTNNS